ncbi:hypothetical protein [Streptomyces sp. gCLA4]|uniref:hypothetical protein n=1 Tax=Streptomyces sp. gCLA4 TaxID=1873416 RepID=UPI0016026A64|nr:hypothetical protein [Streptomyces sp. gCLA4]
MSESRPSRRKKLLREWKAAYWLKQNPPGSQELPEIESYENVFYSDAPLPPDPAERAWLSEQGTPSLSEVRARREAAERSVPAGLRDAGEVPPVWEDVERGRTAGLVGLARAAMDGAGDWPAPPPERYPSGIPVDDGTVITLDRHLRPVQPGRPPGVDLQNEVTIVEEEQP